MRRALDVDDDQIVSLTGLLRFMLTGVAAPIWSPTISEARPILPVPTAGLELSQSRVLFG